MGKGGIGAIAKREERKLRSREEKKAKDQAALDRKCPPAERAMIQTFMAKLPREITIEETKVLGKLFTRHPEAMKLAIEAAREAFINNAQLYIEKHRDAVRAAYAAGEFDIAAKHAEWAIERLGTKEGMLLEQPKVEMASSGPRILVGINMGGIDDSVMKPVDVESTK